MYPKIKICGITNLKDGIASVNLGTDALGFVFYRKSPRYVRPNRVTKIAAQLPPFVKIVGVFVNEPIESIRKIVDLCGIEVVQLHGTEPPEFCDAVNRKVIKAFRIKDSESMRNLSDYKVSAYLLDTYVKGIPGGTGARFDWDLAVEAKKYGRIILAGGLTPANVSEAIKKIQPYGVDVSSSVEKSPGIKDHDKIRKFIEAVKKSR